MRHYLASQREGHLVKSTYNFARLDSVFQNWWFPPCFSGVRIIVLIGGDDHIFSQSKYLQLLLYLCKSRFLIHFCEWYQFNLIHSFQQWIWAGWKVQSPLLVLKTSKMKLTCFSAAGKIFNNLFKIWCDFFIHNTTNQMEIWSPFAHKIIIWVYH